MPLSQPGTVYPISQRFPVAESTKQIAESLNAKIIQLKAKYIKLAKSIHGSPSRKRSSDHKENPSEKPSKPEPAKKLTILRSGDECKRMRRHNSQENIVSSSASNKAAPPKGILRQSSRPNIQPVPAAAESAKKDSSITLTSHGKHRRNMSQAKQSLGSATVKKLLDQARANDKENEVVRNINDRISSHIYYA